MTNRTLKVAAQLAAATALTGSLAACDGRFAGAASDLFASSSSPVSPAQPIQKTHVLPVEPGNPVYNGGSKAENEVAFEQAYGAPLEGSGQQIQGLPKTAYAPSVYNDPTVTEAPIAPYGMSIRSGAETGQVGSEFVAPIPVYSAPVEEVGVTYGSQSALPGPDSGLYTDASFKPGDRDEIVDEGLMSRPDSGATDVEGVQVAYVVENRRGTVVDYEAQPYGSSASLRYSIEEEGLPAPMMTYGEPLESLETKRPVAKDDTTDIEVAFLSGALPLPRARPEAMGMDLKTVALTSPIPAPRPNIVVTAPRPIAKKAKAPKRLAMLSTPLPMARPLEYITRNGRAITDAPPLTEKPTMIEVEPVFTDVPNPAGEKDVASLDQGIEIINEDDFPAAIETEAQPEAELTEKKPLISDEAESGPDTEVASDSDSASELSGTSWRLTQIGEQAVEDASAELHFDGGSGFAGGQSFCNNYGGEFFDKIDGSFEMKNIFTTEAKCPHFSLERKYIAALETAKSYAIAPGLKELRLIGSDGDPIVVFAAF